MEFRLLQSTCSNGIDVVMFVIPLPVGRAPLFWGRGSQIYFSLEDADRGYPAAKTYEATPHGGSPPKFDFKKILGVGT